MIKTLDSVPTRAVQQCLTVHIPYPMTSLDSIGILNIWLCLPVWKNFKKNEINKKEIVSGISFTKQVINKSNY